jgi:hypothetical protein
MIVLPRGTGVAQNHDTKTVWLPFGLVRSKAADLTLSWGPGASAVFGWGQSKSRTKAAPDTIGDIADAAALIGAIDAIAPRYLAQADQGTLIFPACTRKPGDPEGDIRSVWQHTRLEAVRYLTMVPGRQTGLLIDPARQLAMIETFLRQQPHDETMVDFTGFPADDLVIAIIAGLNWLNHCSVLAGVDPARFSGTLRNFRRMAAIARQWWALDGADIRCAEMLQAKGKPPLLLHIVWQDYTRLAKEIASAAAFGPTVEKTVTRRREMLQQELAERPAELEAAIAELKDTMSRFEMAREPDDLLE